jgi:RNA polymerase sigma factor (sigma-70 family)
VKSPSGTEERPEFICRAFLNYFIIGGRTSEIAASREDLPMTTGESVTQWIDQLKQGERESVQQLWERYFARLVRQAQSWLRRRSGAMPAAEAEDVAVDAFDSFCRRAEEGRFPRLGDRDDLWQLLVVIAYRKTCNLVVHEARRQPRKGRVLHASALADGEGASFAEALSREPDPEMVVQAAEECRRLLADLEDDQLRRIALWKMEGYTNESIAAKLGRSLPTVERKLARIRRLWEKELMP